MNYIPQAQGGGSPFSPSSSSSSSSQKQSCFLSLLPPPPPRSASKILPPPRDNRWDVEQDCGKRPTGSSIHPSPKIVNKRSDHLNLARPNSSLSFLEGSTSRDGHPAHTRNGSGLSPRSVYTGGFHPHRMAPAVQIRSVIPVCAAPPVPLMRTQLPNSAEDPLCPPTGPEIPPTSSNPKLDKLELAPDSAQLGSELNKKL